MNDMTNNTATFLLRHNGENATTNHDLYAVVVKQEGDVVTARRPYSDVEFTVNITEQASRCISFDFDMLTQINLYRVAEVELPEGITPDEWITNSVKFKFLFARGADHNWGGDTLRSLLFLDGQYQYAAIRLLRTKNFRSTFRQSMRQQLDQWLATSSEARQYPTPWSGKQFSYLLSTHDLRALRQIDNSTYYSG
jgi:hypothetical protein